MNKNIWHNADKTPKIYKTLIIKTDKGNAGSDMLLDKKDWNTILLPEFYSMEDIDKAEHITEWAYLDDLLALETELERTRKALDVAVDALKDNLTQANFREMLDASRFHCIRTKCESALAEITALEQKDK